MDSGGESHKDAVLSDIDRERIPQSQNASSHFRAFLKSGLRGQRDGPVAQGTCHASLAS